jgi:hypothetical protein
MHFFTEVGNFCIFQLSNRMSIFFQLIYFFDQINYQSIYQIILLQMLKDY